MHNYRLLRFTTYVTNIVGHFTTVELVPSVWTVFVLKSLKPYYSLFFICRYYVRVWWFYGQFVLEINS